MDIIDKVIYETPVEETQQEISQAYKTLFSGANPSACTVIRDLLRKTNFNTIGVPIETNIMYHRNGMCDVIRMIKDSVNRVVTAEDEIEDNEDVNIFEETDIYK